MSDWRDGSTWTAPPDGHCGGPLVVATGWPAGSCIPAPSQDGLEVKPGAAYEHRTPEQLRQAQDTAALAFWIEHRHAQPSAELARKLVDAVLGA
jgi:hypothetical protein